MFRTYLSYRRHAGDPSALSRYADTSLAKAGLSPWAGHARVVSMLSAAPNAARKESASWRAIQADWDEYRSAAARRWQRLSEQQLHLVRGRREQLLKRLQEAYSLTREEAARQIAAWQAQVLVGR